MSKPRIVDRLDSRDFKYRMIFDGLVEFGP